MWLTLADGRESEEEVMEEERGRWIIHVIGRSVIGVVEDVKEMKAKEDTEWVEMEEGGVDVSWIDEGNDMEVDRVLGK